MLRVLVLAPLLSATLAACGGSDTSDRTDLRDAVQSYSDSFLTGDTDGAWALLSARCQEEVGRANYAVIIDLASDLYGDALDITSFDAAIDGDTAKVTYAYDQHSSLDQKDEPWVKEGDDWRNDQCPGVGDWR